MATFSDSKKAISLQDIEAMEAYSELTFPKVYKDFLLKQNGGRCYPSIFRFIQRGQLSDSSVDWFFSIHDGEYNNLKREIRMMKFDEKRMPNHILPIACDALGNLICISCSGKDLGAIYFWDHENEVDYSVSDDSDYSNLFHIADNLESFLNSLTETLD